MHRPEPGKTGIPFFDPACFRASTSGSFQTNAEPLQSLMGPLGKNGQPRPDVSAHLVSWVALSSSMEDGHAFCAVLDTILMKTICGNSKLARSLRPLHSGL